MLVNRRILAIAALYRLDGTVLRLLSVLRLLLQLPDRLALLLDVRDQYVTLTLQLFNLLLALQYVALVVARLRRHRHVHSALEARRVILEHVGIAHVQAAQVKLAALRQLLLQVLYLLLQVQHLVTLVYVQFAQRVQAFAEVALVRREVQFEGVHGDGVDHTLVLVDAARERFVVHLVHRLFNHSREFPFVVVAGRLVV